MQGTVGNAITGLADRGILNSTTTTGALNNISQNAANSLASQYNQDLSSQSQLLEPIATNGYGPDYDCGNSARGVNQCTDAVFSDGDRAERTDTKSIDEPI